MTLEEHILQRVGVNEPETEEGCVCCGAEIVDTGTNDWYRCEDCTPVHCRLCGVCLNCCECDEDDEELL